jgi:hypothetical protein
MTRAQKTPSATSSLAPLSTIESVIVTVRSERVILDADLAKLYGVETRV